MKTKTKNPLYVVKGDEVHPAQNLVDLVVKKLNLEPVFDFLLEMFKMLFEQVQTYTTFIMIKDLFDEFMSRMELFKKFAIL